MWGVIARYGAQAVLWLGTASTGWFLSDWFNESNTTTQTGNVATATGNAPVTTASADWWTKKRIFALTIGLVAFVIWIRRGGLDKFKK